MQTNGRIDKTDRKGRNNVDEVLYLGVDWRLLVHGGGGQDGNAPHHGVVPGLDDNLWDSGKQGDGEYRLGVRVGGSG